MALQETDSTPREKRLRFVPDFKSFLHTLNDYEKEAADTMLTTLRRSHTFHHEPTSNRVMPVSPLRDTYTAYNGPNPSYANPGPSGYYGQPFYPYNGNGGPGDDMYVQGLAKRKEWGVPLPNIYTDRTNRMSLTARRPKLPHLSDEYVHQHSMFMTTTPRVRGHFIIHPDWVSEKSGLRRSLTSLSMIQPSPRRVSRNGLAY